MQLELEAPWELRDELDHRRHTLARRLLDVVAVQVQLGADVGADDEPDGLALLHGGPLDATDRAPVDGGDRDNDGLDRGRPGGGNSGNRYGGEGERKVFAARTKSLMHDVPDLPNFSRFHDAFRGNAGKHTIEGDMRTAFFMAYDAKSCEYIPLNSPEINKRLEKGPDLVSANFVIPYPPGFPIMVPGQVLTQETIDFMRKLDVKEIHGYHAAHGLKLIKPAALAARKAKTGDV